MAPSLQMGSRGPQVSTLQGKLNSALMPSPNLVTDGVFGMKTSQAVRNFQQRKGLAADGVVGPITSAALGMTLGGPGAGPVPPGGGGGPPVPVPGGTPGTAPPGFVDLSMFGAIAEAIITGHRKIGDALLSWIDSDYVPQFVYDQAAMGINGAINGMASQLRGITGNIATMGQDPAAYFTGRVRSLVFPRINALSAALNPLVGLPIIGSIASAHKMALAGIQSSLDTYLTNVRNNGQAVQAVASQIAAYLDGIARRIR